jgi:signal transduction histidine kinase
VSRQGLQTDWGVTFGAMKRLNSELNDIALLSQLDVLRPHHQVVQMAEILSRVDRDWHLFAQFCRVALEVGNSDHLVETDPEMLGAILGSLVGNALKYSGPGGHVRVACR